MKLSHLFLPHPQTHKKAHLISWQAIVAYILMFVFLQAGFEVISFTHPGVLGINSSINQTKLIELTNAERLKKGLSPLRANEKLDLAAKAKAENMFEENYWAHYSPSGKDPWGFINASGYKFSSAGENLARNFYTSEEVVAAWMASPTHRDNLLNSKYQEVGFAALEGVLKGQKTVLIVQEFGRPIEALADLPVDNSKDPPAPETSVGLGAQISLVAGQTQTKALIDPFFTTKVFGLSLISFLMILLIIDIYLLRKRAIVRISSRRLPHLALLTLGAGSLLMMSPGSVL